MPKIALTVKLLGFSGDIKANIHLYYSTNIYKAMIYRQAIWP